MEYLFAELHVHALRPGPNHLLGMCTTLNVFCLVVYRDGQGMKPSDILSLVFSMVQGIRQRHFPYVMFHCGPACPSDKCPGYQGAYISHPGVQQPSSRPHVFNVVQVPSPQKRRISSFYCVNQNFADEFKEWYFGEWIPIQYTVVQIVLLHKSFNFAKVPMKFRNSI